MSFFASLQQHSDLGLLILRFGVGASFLVHGLSKRAMWKMQPSEQMPKSMISILRLLSICEPLGAIAMFVGGLAQLDAACFAIIMLGAIHFKKNVWKKKYAENGGWELDVVLFCASVALFFLGAGAYSIDRILFGL